MPTAEYRANDENDIKTTLAERGYPGVKFGDTENCRDTLEQMAAALTSGDAAQKKAVSDYLTVLQQPNVKPETLIQETNKLENWFDADNDKNQVNNDQLLTNMLMMRKGVADHFNLDDQAGVRGVDLESDKTKLEQLAAKLECSDPSQKKAVSDFQATLEKQWDGKPETLVQETNKLLGNFDQKTVSGNNPNEALVGEMKAKVAGLPEFCQAIANGLIPPAEGAPKSAPLSGPK